MRRMQRIQQGFTLIELMIVVAIVGILAAIAIPAYQDYTVRAKVSEGVNAVDQYRSAVADFYASQGHFPSATASVSTKFDRANYVSSITYNNLSTTSGDLIVTFKSSMNTNGVAGLNLGYVGTGTTSTVVWVCNNTTYTTVAKKYLPANCR